MQKFSCFDEYALARGCGPPPHASFIRTTINMSGAALRRAKARHTEDLSTWQERRDELRVEFDRAVEMETIHLLNRRERIVRRAQGHPDNTSVQVARRLCHKNGWTF